MARGWESKNVEDQIAESENARRTAAKPALSPAEMARRSQRESLKLSRATTLSQLQTACDSRYRALLERTLAHIDEQLASLESPESPESPDKT
jgi:hypothetical protein